MRFFGGLSVEETAGVLKVSPITVIRDWNLAKVWLYRELSKAPGSARRPAGALVVGTRRRDASAPRGARV